MAKLSFDPKEIESIVDNFEYSDHDPGHLNNMFGSLFGVALTRPEARQKLTDNWYKIVRRWYPNLHQQIYCSPPLHFNAVAFKPKPAKRTLIPEFYERYGIYRYLPVQYSSVKSDESQQRLLGTLRAFAQKKGVVSQFLVSNMEFQNYLNKSYEWADPGYENMPKPNIKIKDEEGEIDILIIDKALGIIILEIKAVGNDEEIWNELTYAKDEKQQKLKKFAEVHHQLERKIGKQLGKGKRVIRKLLSDLEPSHPVDKGQGQAGQDQDRQKINIRGGFVLVNVTRDFFREALEAFKADPNKQDEFENLLKRMDVKDIDGLCDITICAEGLPSKDTPCEETITEEVFHNMDKVWNNILKLDGGGEDRTMSDNMYEKIVARFCGPLTTVKIYTEKTYPRVKLEVTIKPKVKGRKPEKKVKMVTEQALSKADASRIMARRFSELVLLQEQIEILQRNEEFVHLEGPPGTGKTLMLLLRILTWLDDGHMVWIVSLSPPSRSITHVLMEQVKKMIGMHKTQAETDKILKRLRFFMMTRPENTLDVEYFKRRLLKFRMRCMRDPSKVDSNYLKRTASTIQPPHRDLKVCLALDETGMAGKGLADFFEWVAKLHRDGTFRGKDYDQGLSVWSAAVERVGRPVYVTKPGTTDEEKFGVLWDLKMPLRCPPSVQRALILVQPSLDQDNVCCFTEEMTLSHPAKQKGAENREMYAADGLPVFLIAHGSHKHPEKDIWYCFECGDELANYLQNELHIGEEECNCEDKPVIYEEIVEKFCPDCKKLTKGTLPVADLPLKYNDVMIVATQRAFQFSVPIDKFALALAKRGLKVAVNTTREEGEAPIPVDDVILIADVTSVHGLERAIIVVVPEVNDPPPLPARYRGILYPEPPFLPDPREQKLPKEVEDAIAEAERTGKDGVTMTADGRMEEDIDDDIPSNTEQPTLDPQLVNQDPHIKEAIEKGACFTVTGKEEVEFEPVSNPTQDVEMKDLDTPTKPDNPTPAQDSEMPAAGASATNIPPTAEAEEGAADSHISDSTAFAEPEIPYTYNDAFSKQEITAALRSLTPQSRQDVFYIGSRAVCQMILIHLGKNTRIQDPQSPSEEPMQSD